MFETQCYIYFTGSRKQNVDSSQKKKCKDTKGFCQQMLTLITLLNKKQNFVLMNSLIFSV